MEIQLYREIIETILKAGIVPVIVIVIFILIYHWNKIEEFASSIHRFFIFSKNKKDFGRIRSTLQTDINKSILEITKEAPGCFAEAVKVEWLSEGKDLINVDEKAIYIKLNKDSDVDQLFLRTLSLLFERAFLIESRRFIHHHLFTGLTLILSKRIIANSRFRSATPLFYETIHNPKLLDKSIALLFKKLTYLDEQGLFTRVFLNECAQLPTITGIELLGSQPKWDINKFLDFTVTLFKTIENKDQRIDFEFKSKTINIAYAVLADSYIGHSMGISFYINRTKQSIIQGASIIYIIAIGKYNIQLAYKLAHHLTNRNLISGKKISNYFITNDNGENTPAITIRCKTAPHAMDSIVDANLLNRPEVIIDDPLLSDILKSIITDPEIQFVKTAWIKGYQAQVVVNSLNSQKDPVYVCIGKNGDISKEINAKVGDFVRFVRWSTDTLEAIRNNLDKHKNDDIVQILIDPMNRISLVYASSILAIQHLCGPNKNTLFLAEAITDYSIRFKLDPKTQILEVLNKNIPEISLGKIQIVNIVIFPNQEIRILVRSQSMASPEKTCASYLDKIVADLQCEEVIYFCNQCDLVIDTIYGSLFPLRRSEIKKIKSGINDNFTVYVKDKFTLNKALGKDGVHIKAVNKLLGVRIQIEVDES